MRWYHIKGVDILLEAFLREFSGDEDVRLFLKTTSNNKFELDGSGVNQAVRHLIQELGITNPPEIGIRTEMMSDQHLMDLYGLADAFAFPSRAECVGISWAQAMHSGTPVVTNNWSAMEYYISDDEAVLVDEGETKHPESRVNWVPRKGGEWFPDEAEWFEADIGAVQEGMRTLFEMSEEERTALGERGQKMVHDTFSWDEHIETRVDRFEQLAE
jgi:glycosyltransferase involved in cell wall biosynthesis